MENLTVLTAFLVPLEKGIPHLLTVLVYGDSVGSSGAQRGPLRWVGLGGRGRVGYVGLEGGAVLGVGPTLSSLASVSHGEDLQSSVYWVPTGPSYPGPLLLEIPDHLIQTQLLRADNCSGCYILRVTNRLWFYFLAALFGMWDLSSLTWE